jgi:hypothetical protein
LAEDSQQTERENTTAYNPTNDKRGSKKRMEEREPTERKHQKGTRVNERKREVNFEAVREIDGD